ncbi:MAG TPA: DUF445 family protein [Bacillota bacterium]|nr:DUF445 family protein [Bacillota bacterium]
MGWFDFGKELFMGGVTGYITNDIAVKMLFRKYGPFGGVILDTKDQFIDKISKLVERDIITHKTLQPELSGPAFKNIMTTIVGEIIHQTLAEKTPVISIGKIPGFDEFAARLTSFINTYQKEAILQLQNSVFANTPLDILLTEAQAGRLSREIMRLAVTTIQDREFIATIIREYYGENREVPLGEYLNKRIIHQIVENFKQSTAGLHQQIQERYNPLIDQKLGRFYQIFELDRVFAKIETNLKQKRLSDLIGYENTESVSREIINNLARILKSAEGRQLIANVTESIINHLAGLPSSIVELLNPEVQDELHQFMENEFPGLLDEFKNWIQNNKTAIENLIDQAVDEVLEEGAKGLFNIKGKLKKLLKDILIGYNVAARFSVVHRIAAALEDNSELSESASERITARLYEFIERTSIGEIVTLLRAHGIIQTSHITNIIYQNIDYYIGRIDPALFNDWYETRLGDIIHTDLKKLMADYTRNVLYQWIKNDFLYSEKFTRGFHQEISKIADRFSDQKLSEIVSPDMVDKISLNIQKELLQTAELNKSNWQGLIGKAIVQFGKGKNLAAIVDEKMQANLASGLSDGLAAGLKDKLAEMKYTDIRSVYQKIQAIPDIEAKLSQIVVTITADNIDILLKGNIEGSVNRNLSALPERDMQKTIEDFMGKELKPISLFGAILGAGFGVGTFLAKEAFFPGQNRIFSLGLSMGVCALVGWLTNVIAIRMIFRPYKKWRFLGIKIPFTPGVVAKQQARFAKNMANFIDQKLLNPEMVSGLFMERSEEIHQSILASISADDYRLLGELLGKNSDAIVKGVITMAERFINENRAKIVDMLLEYLKMLDLPRMDFSEAAAKGQLEIMSQVKNLDGFIQNRLQEIIHQDHTVAKILPPFAKQLVRDFVEGKTDEALSLIRDILSDRNRIENIMNGLSGNFNEVIEKSLSELISQSEQEKIKGQVCEKIVERLQAPSSRQQFYQYLNEKFLVEFNEEKPIGELFDGKIISVLRNNAGFITDYINQYIQSYLEEERYEIAGQVSEQVNEAMGAWSFIGRWANVDGDIRQIVYKLIDTKIPGFLDAKAGEIKRIITRIINEKIARRKIRDLGFAIDGDGIVNTIESVLKDPPVISSVQLLSGSVLDAIFGVKIKKYLSLMSVKELKDFARILTEEIGILSLELGATLDDSAKQQQIKAEFWEALDIVLDGLVYSIKVKDLMNGLNAETIQNSAKRLLTQIAGSKCLNQQLNEFLRELVERIQYQRPDELIDFQELRNSFIQILERLAPSEGFLAEIKEILATKVQLLAGATNQILPAQMKDFAAAIILSSFLEALKAHFLEIINTVNFGRVTEEVVKTMRPQEIEAMFYSFAGKYFQRLEVYGIWGGVLGLLSLVS